MLLHRENCVEMNEANLEGHGYGVPLNVPCRALEQRASQTIPYSQQGEAFMP